MRIIILLIILANSLSASQRYEIYCDENLLRIAVQIAHREVGTTETGENRGDVEKYHAIAGINAGLPYCAAGIYYCFKIGADSLGLGENVIPIPNNPLSNGIFAHAKRFGNKTEFRAKNNDLIVWRAGKSNKGHIEWIIETGKGGNVRTIGFNVKSPEKPHKEGVFYRKRNIFTPISRMYVRGMIGFRNV